MTEEPYKVKICICTEDDETDIEDVVAEGGDNEDSRDV